MKQHIVLSILLFALNTTLQLNAQTTNELLNGKRIGVIGDSYVKNHKEPIENTWHFKLAQKHGMKYYNYGRNGNSIAHSSKRWGEAIYKRYTQMNDSLDYIVIIAGHNDGFYLDSIGGIDVFKSRMSRSEERRVGKEC